MNPEQWLSLKWNGGSTMSDRWLNQSKIIQLSCAASTRVFALLKLAPLPRTLCSLHIFIMLSTPSAVTIVGNGTSSRIIIPVVVSNFLYTVRYS